MPLEFPDAISGGFLSSNLGAGGCRFHCGYGVRPGPLRDRSGTVAGPFRDRCGELPDLSPPPTSATPIEDRDSYPSETRGLEGVQSRSSRGVVEFGGSPPSPGRPADSGPLLPNVPEPPVSSPVLETPLVPPPPRPPDLPGPWGRPATLGSEVPGGHPDLPGSRISRGRRQWRSHRNKFKQTRACVNS